MTSHRPVFAEEYVRENNEEVLPNVTNRRRLKSRKVIGLGASRGVATHVKDREPSPDVGGLGASRVRATHVRNREWSSGVGDVGASRGWTTRDRDRERSPSIEILVDGDEEMEETVVNRQEAQSETYHCPRMVERSRHGKERKAAVETLTNSELYERKLQEKYEELKELVLRSLDPHMISPLVKREAQQLLQQYHGTRIGNISRTVPRTFHGETSGNSRGTGYRQRKVRSVMTRENREPGRVNIDSDAVVPQSVLRNTMPRRVEHGHTENSELLSTAERQRKKVSFEDQLSKLQTNAVDVSDSDNDICVRHEPGQHRQHCDNVTKSSKAVKIRSVHVNEKKNEDAVATAADCEYPSDFTSSSDDESSTSRPFAKSEQCQQTDNFSCNSRPSSAKQPQKVRNSSNRSKKTLENSESPGQGDNKVLRVRRIVSDQTCVRSKKSDEKAKMVKEAWSENSQGGRSRMRGRSRGVEELSDQSGDDGGSHVTASPVVSKVSQSPKRLTTTGAGYHLKFTANDDIRNWLRMKNQLVRQERLEKKRLEREKRKERREKEKNKEERQQMSEAEVQRWMMKKKREDKLLKTRRRRFDGTESTGSVSQGSTRPRARISDTSTSGNSTSSGTSGVPSFSRLGKYDSFPGASTWHPPSRHMSEVERRKAYGDWLRNNRRETVPAMGMLSHEAWQTPSSNQGVNGWDPDLLATSHAPPPSQKSKLSRPLSHQRPSSGGVVSVSGLNGKEAGDGVGCDVSSSCRRGVRSRPQSAKVRQVRPEPQGADHSEVESQVGLLKDSTESYQLGLKGHSRPTNDGENGESCHNDERIVPEASEEFMLRKKQEETQKAEVAEEITRSMFDPVALVKMTMISIAHGKGGKDEELNSNNNFKTSFADDDERRSQCNKKTESKDGKDDHEITDGKEFQKVTLTDTWEDVKSGSDTNDRDIFKWKEDKRRQFGEKRHQVSRGDDVKVSESQRDMNKDDKDELIHSGKDIKGEDLTDKLTDVSDLESVCSSIQFSECSDTVSQHELVL
jgi:hypothetical protein